jgi:hypothetical protein
VNYEQDIVIDETVLDVEWLDQPRRMGDYCKVAAEAHKAMGLAEENQKFVWASLAKAIRTNPSEYGVVPGSRGITEDAIKETIQLQTKYRDAVRAFIEAKYEHDVAAGAVRAFDTRKRSLENLVQLHGQQYFAGPRVPHDLSAERAERARRDREVQRNVRIAPLTHTTPAAMGLEQPRQKVRRRN